MRRRATFAALVFALVLPLSIPFAATAAPFGGQVALAIPCFNGALYAFVGPPRGGAFLWTPATETYRFGPPTHSGQWVLGLSGIPYFCVVSIVPIIVSPGISIVMMGSSQ